MNDQPTCVYPIGIALSLRAYAEISERTLARTEHAIMYFQSPSKACRKAPSSAPECVPADAHTAAFARPAPAPALRISFGSALLSSRRTKRSSSLGNLRDFRGTGRGRE